MACQAPPPVIAGLGIAAEAGAPLTSLQRDATVEVRDGHLEPGFRPAMRPRRHGGGGLL